MNGEAEKLAQDISGLADKLKSGNLVTKQERATAYHNVSPISEELRNRIKSMTEHEMVYALCTNAITTEQVYAVHGDYPLSRSVISEYEKYKTAYENPESYWQARIDRLEELARELREKKIGRESPPIPYSW